MDRKPLAPVALPEESLATVSGGHADYWFSPVSIDKSKTVIASQSNSLTQLALGGNAVAVQSNSISIS